MSEFALLLIRRYSGRLISASVLTVLGGFQTVQSQVGQTKAVTRTYFIAAEAITWDYLSGGKDEIAGVPYVDSGFFANASPRVESTKYRKVLYREYTDGTFRTLKTRSRDWDHLGFLGPLLRAVVGDTLRVVFRNNANRSFSIHPHGIFYDKGSEGAPYNDRSSPRDKHDDAVPPGSTYTYRWIVPARAGPGPMDGSSVMWMYHSRVDEVRDINEGLVGPMIITARNMARADGSPKDVDRELVAEFAQVHEDDAWDAETNLPPIDSARILSPIPNPSERQAGFPWYVKFAINGYIRGTLPLAAFTVRKGQRVRWYLMSSTNDFDFHSPHWHGNTVLIGGMRTDVAPLGPMQMIVADMIPDDVGIWLFHCHISFHNEAGMAVRYRVLP